MAQAGAAYRAERFEEAVKLYQSAAAAGARSAALFYNLGNAEFRTGALGQAILNYERALTLQPSHPEARANLLIAREKARALELRSRWWERYTARTTPRQLTLASAVAFWSAAVLLVMWRRWRRRSILLPFFGAVAVLVCVAAAAAVYAMETGPHGQALAIITGGQIEARVATADSAGSVLLLPTGSEINILSTRGDWIYAALPNDLRGWIPAGSAERVRL